MSNEIIGKRIKMVFMDDPQPIQPDSMGTIIGIDGIGQYQVEWNNGRTLSVIPEIDKFVLIKNNNDEK
jgi:hypothetical protein